MKRISVGLLVLGVAIHAAMGSELAPEKKVQFGLAITGLAATPDTGDARGTLGPGAIVHCNLGRSFIIAPEVTAGLTGLYGGLTVNFRVRRFFAGVGGGLLYFYEENQDIQGDGMLKAQVGFKGSRWLFSAAYLSNIFSGGWLNGVQLTLGYLF